MMVEATAFLVITCFVVGGLGAHDVGGVEFCNRLPQLNLLLDDCIL